MVMSIQEASEILDLQPNPTKIQVKKAFNKLAIIHHPDKCKEHPQLAENFVQINKAYKYLIDFVPSLNENDQVPAQQPPPNEYQLSVPLEEIFRGCIRNEKINIKITDQNGIETKQERTVQVLIKPGVMPSTRITVERQGDKLYGMIPANVVFIVNEMPQQTFKRFRFDLECLVKITAEEACHGKFSVVTIESEKINHKIDELITSKTVHRIPNHGMPIPDGAGKRGDLLVKFEIIYDFQDPPIEIDILLTLEQIYNGTEKRFKINRSIIDSDGNEEMEQVILQVPIKPGAKSATKITFPKEGDRRHGSTPADIIFTVVEKPHGHFKRNGPNLEYTATVAPIQKGTLFEVPILAPNKEVLRMTIDDDILSGAAVRSFPGYGLPYSTDTQKFGVLKVKFVVVDNEAIDSPIRCDLFVTLEEILHGCEKRRKITRKIFDIDGNETLEEKTKLIVIKPGTEEGKEFIFPRSGDLYPGSIPADIIFVLCYRSHKCFSRNEVDLEYIARLTQSTFANGGVIKIPTLDSELNLSLDTIVNPSKPKRFSGHGLPHRDNKKQRGNLVVRFDIIDDPEQDPEVIHELLLMPNQMLEGCTKNVKISRTVLDELGVESLEENILEVKIEPQSEDGTRIVFQQASHQSPGRLAADIVFVIRRKPQDPPVEHRLELALEDILKGCVKRTQIARKIFDRAGVKQSEEINIVEIKIKPGTKEGTRFTFSQEGDRRPGVTPADVVFIVQFKLHQHFKPTGVHLEYTHEIKSDEIDDITRRNALQLSIPTLDGEFVKVNFAKFHHKCKIDEKRIANYGLPHLVDPKNRGDLIVKFKIIYVMKFRSRSTELNSESE